MNYHLYINQYHVHHWYLMVECDLLFGVFDLFCPFPPVDVISDYFALLRCCVVLLNLFLLGSFLVWLKLLDYCCSYYSLGLETLLFFVSDMK